MEGENAASGENFVDNKSTDEIVQDDKTNTEDDMKMEVNEEGSKAVEGSGVNESNDEAAANSVQQDNLENDDKSKDNLPEIDWNDPKHILFVSGMPPGESGSLKQLLNTTLGAGCHRIKPRVKGDTDIYVVFRSHDEMKVAESLLHNQKFLKHKLTAKVVDGSALKKRPPPREKQEEPNPKKMKKNVSTLGQQFLKGSYEDQIAMKMDDVQSRLHKVAKLMLGSYPKYGPLIFNRQAKHDGVFCEVVAFKQCPSDQRFATRCKFAIGLDETTGEPSVGIRVAKGDSPTPLVKDISTVNHNYPEHVIDAAKVFEKAVKASEKAPGKCNFWHELVIRTNIPRDLMLMVFVHCKQDSAADELKSLNEELKEFFENGEGKDCRLVALFTKAVCTDVGRPQQQSMGMELVLGNSYLEETVMDFKLHLLPMMYFWNSVHAAKMVCEGLLELITPSKNVTLLEIGCGIGLIGFYFSRLAGQVLSVDIENMAEEAKKNAERNEIEIIEYFSGKAEDMIPEMAKKMKHEKSCAIVISSVNPHSTCPKAMDELRKIEKMKRIVLVTEMSTSRFSPIISLAKLTNDKTLGNPFFPVKAIPVDTMPNSKSYVLLVLLERIGFDSLPKKIKKSAASKLKMKEATLPMNRKQDKRPFAKKGPKQWGRKGRFLLHNPYDPYNYNPFNHYGPNPYHLQQMLAEERQRRMEVEEQRRWLLEQQRMKQMKVNNDPVKDLISDSLKEAGVPQLNADVTQKLKQVIAEAIKSAGVLGKDEQGKMTDEHATGISNAGACGTDSMNWSQTPAGLAAKQGPQSLMGMKMNPQGNQGDMYTRRGYHGDYTGGNAGGFGQSDRMGGKPFYAANQDNMYGRPPSWNTGEPVQYPLGNNMQYGRGGYGNWQGGAAGYATYDMSGSNQRGGFRNMNQGKPRYFS